MSLSLEYSSRKVDFDLRLICLLRQRCDFLSLSLSFSLSLSLFLFEKNENVNAIITTEVDSWK